MLTGPRSKASLCREHRCRARQFSTGREALGQVAEGYTPERGTRGEAPAPRIGIRPLSPFCRRGKIQGPKKIGIPSRTMTIVRPCRRQEAKKSEGTKISRIWHCSFLLHAPRLFIRPCRTDGPWSQLYDPPKKNDVKQPAGFTRRRPGHHTRNCNIGNNARSFSRRVR